MKNENHRKWVAKHLCCVCVRNIVPTEEYSCQAAHVKFLGQRGTAPKNDMHVVPLCVQCHAEQHAHGNEEDWWESKGLDPAAFVKRLVARSPFVKEAA